MSPARPSRWYRLAVATATRAAAVAAAFDGKLARGLAARQGLAARYATWAAAHRDHHRPLIWFHAPSVGEGLQIQPVLEALRAVHPRWQLVFSFFSPSAEHLARTLPADFADYAPFDRPPDVAAALDALSPAALVYGKLDVWPEWTLMAASRGVRLGLLAGTVAPGSSRLHWPARRWSAPAYGALDRVGAVAEADAERLCRLGVRRDALTITGDTRYDSVIQRARALDRSREPLASLSAGAAAFTIVAGSTWPADEAVLLPAFAALHRAAGTGVRLIVAPHEPTAAHLTQLATAARQAGLPTPVSLSQLEHRPAEVAAPLIVIDRVGVLADVYALGQVAYVGGGYHRAGLHSTLEPAVFGIPVCVGPRWQMSRDAEALLAAGGLVTLPWDGVTALRSQWSTWRDDPEARARAGTAAAAVVAAGGGATARSVALVESLVERKPYG
jgi:3-deoxy-D-manno-octulosonic-acid transferase